MADTVPILIVLPFFGSLIALTGKLLPWKKLAAVVAVLSVPASAVLLALQAPAILAGKELVYAVGGWPAPYGIVLQLDGFAWFSSVLTLSVAVAVVIAAFARPGYGPQFCFFLLLLVAGMQMVVLTNDLFNMFVGFEIVAIAAYVLIAFDRSADGLLASFKYLILSSVGIIFFLFGVFLVYRDFGVLSMESVQEILALEPGLADTTSIQLAVVALCVGIGVRTAFIPFHTWLPEAHAYAPHPISALLSGALIKVSFFALVRILWTFSGDYLYELLMWIGAATAFMAVVWALAQTDAKRLLAFHSVSQMGYVLAAFGAGAFASTAAASYHALNHALFKSLLFLAVGTAVRMTGERDLYAMPALGRRAPVLALTFAVGALSIAGIPPFNGYAGKQLISYALAGEPAYVLVWLTGIGTVASFIKLSRIFRPAPARPEAGGPKHGRSGPTSGESNPPDPHLSRPGFLIHVPTVFLAALCVATGVFAPYIAPVIHRLVGAAGTLTMPPAYTAGKLGQTAIMVALGVGLYFLVTAKPGKRASAWIRRRSPELRTVLIMFFLGLALFAAVALV
jgi:formate hydrogenlyase subunit 3/multisubunit Na+/H+ antiporter MnhD subunit